MSSTSTIFASNGRYVRFQVEEIRVLNETGDDPRVEFQEGSEMQLLTIIKDGRDGQFSSETIYPSNGGAITAMRNEWIDISGPLASSIDTWESSNEIYVYVVAYDSDEWAFTDGFTSSDGLEVLSDLGLGLDLVLEANKFRSLGYVAAGAAAPVTIPWLLLAEVGIETTEYAMQADVLGEVPITLKRSQGWNTGLHKIISRNGNLEVIYRVIMTDEVQDTASVTPESCVIPTSGPWPPCATQPQQPVNAGNTGNDCGHHTTTLEVGVRAEVVFDQVNMRSTAGVPSDWGGNIIATLPNGEIVRIDRGPQCAHNGHWWYISRENGMKGWVKERSDSNIFLRPVEPTIEIVPPIIVANPTIRNGGFESGGSFWDENSSEGYNIINDIFNADHITARSGRYVAWFGNLHNETAHITQEVVVPSGNAKLTFWYQIRSDERCGNYDYVQVKLDALNIQSGIVLKMNLCKNGETTTWRKKTIDVSSMSGETVNLQFYSKTDRSRISSFYLDDVYFE